MGEGRARWREGEPAPASASAHSPTTHCCTQPKPALSQRNAYPLLPLYPSSLPCLPLLNSPSSPNNRTFPSLIESPSLSFPRRRCTPSTVPAPNGGPRRGCETRIRPARLARVPRSTRQTVSFALDRCQIPSHTSLRPLDAERNHQDHQGSYPIFSSLSPTYSPRSFDCIQPHRFPTSLVIPVSRK